MKNKIKLFKKMLNKQKELNDLTYPTWMKELTPVNWQSAVLVEAGELLESFGYKWWKKQKKDIKNVKVELIDILHFLLSELLYVPDNIKNRSFKNFYEHGFLSDAHDIEDDHFFQENVIYLINNSCVNIMLQFLYLAKLFKYVGMDFDEVYKDYFVKNILNEFRQKHGYKEGNYLKMWNVELGDGVKVYEDNVVAFHLANKISLEKLDEVLPKELERIYSSLRT